MNTANINCETKQCFWFTPNGQIKLCTPILKGNGWIKISVGNELFIVESHSVVEVGS